MRRPVPRSASIRTRLAATGSVLSIRQINGLLPPTRWGIGAGRGLIATVMAAGGPPLRGTTTIPVRAAGVRGEMVRAPGVPLGEQVIYYVHGSGYVICSARTHRGLASRLSQETGLPVFVVDYRLAPEHRFPAAADDVAAGYRWLLANGYAAANIVMGGDSAGCHLTLDLLLENSRTAMAQPAGAFMFSPLMDLTLTAAETLDRRRPDPMAPAPVGRRMIRLYTGDEPADSTRLRLTIPPDATLPPLFVQAAAGEMLADDARQLHDMATSTGNRCELELWPGRIHVFQALPLIVPEATPALRRAARFVTETLAQANAPIREWVS
ncbi:alpha/beta hydrolase [Nocardia cyriacigeorgica]|nr:alpha/beta hydrolase [Nocardia cyriacigeorgica]MBF6323640.1 alpha/beta hydrolase [Nocardia cyriacigeorgica]TLF59265.1 alpha/beta hydrolase [Nocardia cyriacigeorgica]